MTTLRTAAQQALEALEAMQSYAAAERKGLRICDEAIPALKAALAEPDRAQKMRDAGYTRRPTLREMAEPESCQYPDCVDNGPEGKCTRWMLAECSKSEDYKPQRPTVMVRGPVAGAATSVHDKAYSEVELAAAYQKGWSDAMLRRSLGPHIIKEGT